MWGRKVKLFEELKSLFLNTREPNGGNYFPEYNSYTYLANTSIVLYERDGKINIYDNDSASFVCAGRFYYAIMTDEDREFVRPRIDEFSKALKIFKIQEK